MTLRLSVVALFGFVCVSLAASQESPDLSKTVFPITEISVLTPTLKNLPEFHGVGVEGKFGTGFCLDPACRFIATNYHVAAALGQARKIEGEKVVQRYLATGPDDEGATINQLEGFPALRYSLDRDLAIFELRRPLSRHEGVVFSMDDLGPGQLVTIYGYPKESWSRTRKLTAFHAKFVSQDTDGLLAFEYEASAKKMRGGVSGGIVIDDKTGKIVGVLSGVARNANSVALAVSIDSLSDFVYKVEPYLAQQLFPTSKVIPPVAVDLYPKFIPPPVNGLQHRTEESPTIRRLRRSAQSLSVGMRDFIATQSLAWGSGNSEPSALARYEVRVIDGAQQFRELPDGKKELNEIPFPALNNVVIPGAEWSELARMVGTELGLKLHEAPDSLVGDKHIHVFQYSGAQEDRVCPWRSAVDLGLFTVEKHSMVSCYGEVWTDDEMNIIRMSLHQEINGPWRNPEVQITYGRLRKMDEPPRLIPLTIAVQAEYHKKLYWCRGQFTDYRIFGSRVKILASDSAANLH